MMVVFFFLPQPAAIVMFTFTKCSITAGYSQTSQYYHSAHEKGLKCHAQPQTDANSCLALTGLCTVVSHTVPTTHYLDNYV